MPETLGSNVRDYLLATSKSVGRLSHALEVIEELGIADLRCYPSIDYYSANQISIRLTPAHDSGIGLFTDGHSIAMEMVDTTPVMLQIARLLLPKVGKFDKGFEEEQNNITLTCVYRDVKLVLYDSPPKTCTVERVEEVIEVPEKVIPAHKEKKVRFVMVGDCDPLMQTHIETSQGNVEIPQPVPAAADEDVPF